MLCLLNPSLLWSETSIMAVNYSYYFKFLYTEDKIMKPPSRMQSNAEGQLI